MKSKAFCDIKFWVPNLSFNSSFPQLSWPLICIIIKSYMDLMDCVLTKENWAVIGMYSEKSQTCTKRNYSFGPQECINHESDCRKLFCVLLLNSTGLHSVICFPNDFDGFANSQIFISFLTQIFFYYSQILFCSFVYCC